jgi:spore germination protein KC
MSRHRRWFCALLILLLALSGGCWDQNEVEDLAVVRAMGVDYLPGREAPYLVTLAIKRPSGIAGEGAGGASGSPTELYTGVGASFDLAIQQASLRIPKGIFLAHTEIVIAGEELAKFGVGHLVDFIIRNPQLRLDTNFLVAEGFAHDVLNVPERLESSISEELLALIDDAGETSEANPQPFFQFAKQMASVGQDAQAAIIKSGPRVSDVIPLLKQGNTENSGGSGEEAGEEGGGGEKSGGQKQENVLSLAGMAVFRGDRLAGTLDYIETRGVLWLQNEINRVVLAVRDPVNPDQMITLHIARSETKVTPVIQEGRFFFRVAVNAEGDILSQASTADLSNPEMVEKINSALAGAIKEVIEKGFARLQEMQTDVVGFGTILNRRHNDLYKSMAGRWPEEFSTINLEIHVTANIRRTGQHSNPARVNR